MNFLLKIFTLAMVMTFVYSDEQSDTQEVQARVQTIQNLTQSQLQDRVDNYAEPLLNMTYTRADKAKAKGLNCYYDLYQVYLQHMNDTVASLRATIANETARKQYPDLKEFVCVLEGVMWDELNRRNNNDIAINSQPKDGDCTFTLNAQFLANLAKLKAGLLVFTGKSRLIDGFDFMTKFYGGLAEKFAVIYPQALLCCNKINDTKEKDRCLKVFVDELDRFIYVSTIKKQCNS